MLGRASAMWPPGEGAHCSEPPPRPKHTGSHASVAMDRHPVQLQARTSPWVHPAKDAPAGRFTHSRHEFLETVILNQDHRLLIYTYILYISLHTDLGSHGCTTTCAHTHPVVGQYLPPTQILLCIRHRNPLTTGLHLDAQQLTIQNCLYMHKNTHESTATLYSQTVVCPKDSWALPLAWRSGGGGVLGFHTGAGLSPMHSVLCITTRIELIVKGAPDPWPPIGSWLPWATGLSLGLPERHVCKMGAGLLASNMLAPA